MKKSIFNLILTVLLAWLFATLSMEWWSVMAAAALAGFIVPLKGFKVFLIPLLGIFIFWSIYAYVLGSANNFILSEQIGVLLNIGKRPLLVVLITGLLGGVAAGVAGILGKQLASVRAKK
jgi:hypothetical protein